MQSEQWVKNRKAGEDVLRALGNVTPDVLKTLQDKELERIIVLLGEVAGACGREHSERPKTRRRSR
jgi:hypothetical protein